MSANPYTESVTNSAKRTAERMTEEATRTFEASTKRFEELNVSAFESQKAMTRVSVDTYESAAKNIFEMQRQMVEASPVDWAKDAAKTQIQFAEDVTDAWTRAARKLLK